MIELFCLKCLKKGRIFAPNAPPELPLIRPIIIMNFAGRNDDPS